MLYFIGGKNEKDLNCICFYMLVSCSRILWIGPRHVCRWLYAGKTANSYHSPFDFRYNHIYFHQAIEKNIQLIHNKT